MPFERPRTVAVLNTNDDVVELLRILFEQRGHAVVTAHVDAIKRSQMDIGAFVRLHRPDVVVYDIPPPYDTHWTFMNHVRTLPEFESIPFVLTTTNERRLREIVGRGPQLLEIVGKPYDLDQIAQAVEEALRERA
jgi:CheY-like chemotaxis protein